MAKEKKTVVDLVKREFRLPSDAALARLLNVDRSCVHDWRVRLGGGIPTRHWAMIMRKAKVYGAKITVEDLWNK